MTIKPLDDRILLEPLEANDRTPSGLYIPDTAKEKPRMGLVIAVGTDEDLQSKVKQGNRVLVSTYSGDEIDVNGKPLRIVQRSDILAVIED